MIKLKGQEFPVSLYKFYLPDALVSELEFIKNQCKLKDNSEAFTSMVRQTYNQVKAMVEWAEKQPINDTTEVPVMDPDPEC